MEAIKRVLGLLDYIEEAEKLKKKPAYRIPTEHFVAHQHDLDGLPELEANLQVDGDPVWLRVPRLQEVGPPALDATLAPWVTLSKGCDEAPELNTSVTVGTGRESRKLALEDHFPDIPDRFDWYVEVLWTPWATVERQRRKTMALYAKLFALYQAIGAEGAEAPLELVWGFGYATWKPPGAAQTLAHPLVLQLCEVSLNETTFELEIRPRDQEARLELDCYAAMELPGVTALEAHWKATLAAEAERVDPFQPATWEGTLRAAVGYLDPLGSYESRTDDLSLPAPTDRLVVTSTWVLFGRKRSVDVFLEDVRRLKRSVEDTAELPKVIRSFVEHGDDTVRVRPEQSFRGLSSVQPASGAHELYFPMPYNDEQVSIVQKLYANDGVVVQGPPGTGKTHTIANVICHYLAQGKRVLVTARGESALAVLQEKLPERIRPLSVSLLSDEREGMKQFEHAIQTIATRVSAMQPAQSQRAIDAAQATLDRLHAKLAHLDQTVAERAAQHLREHRFQGQDLTAEQLAKLVLEQADQHGWFDDEPTTPLEALLLADADIVALRNARQSVGEDLAVLGCQLPTPEQLPGWAELLALHRDLVKARNIDTGVSQGAVLPLRDGRRETAERAGQTLAFLERRDALRRGLESSAHPWLPALRARLAGVEAGDPAMQAFAALCAQVKRLETQRKEDLARAVMIPVDAELNPDYLEAIKRSTEGQRAFALPFGKSQARQQLAATTVLGSAPRDAREWAHVTSALAFRAEVRKAVARWQAFGDEFGLALAPDTLEASLRQMALRADALSDLQQLKDNYDAHLGEELAVAFGVECAQRLYAPPAQGGGEAFVNLALSSLRAHQERTRLVYAGHRARDLVARFADHDGTLVDELRDFLGESLGRPTADETVLQTTWQALSAEASRLHALKPKLDEIARVTGALRAAGATCWAGRLTSVVASGDLDLATPLTWREAWAWREAVMFLDGIDGHRAMRDLFEERRHLSVQLAEAYQTLVAEKTWLGVHNNSPDSVRQALQAYLNAVQAMGTGVGVRAARHRRSARTAMLRAYKAVPCWVLPEYRVSETLPAEVGLFDLVVVDEASQSDIWALPALLRGKKLLVVGDHMQVSPSAVGTAEEQVKTLSQRFLADQPHGAEMTPDKSIYDLARVVFAGNSVMLKEHFRSVPAIIEFSKREFYNHDIRPLRVPKANERLDPPLIDVFVHGGQRTSDVNKAEAMAIVDEIEAILKDPQCAGRSIGVVTLVGTAQAAHIHDLVGLRIAPHDIVARRIAVGPPPVFQGRERDIMLISMVLGPNDRVTANRADMRQRFNVALSRARDRMVLFRSVPSGHYGDDTLNGRLLAHFEQPFHQDPQKTSVLRDRCQSGFERDMFDELVKDGYRVEPQVPSGGYFIDFVVEGREGRRLAIECDGDRFHGPSQWDADMARQRVLERAGWTFWRCFASTFKRKRTEVLEDLRATLDGLGIEPLGAESVDTSQWVKKRDADPLQVVPPEAKPEQEPEPTPVAIAPEDAGGPVGTDETASTDSAATGADLPEPPTTLPAAVDASSSSTLAAEGATSAVDIDLTQPEPRGV